MLLCFKWFENGGGALLSYFNNCLFHYDNCESNFIMWTHIITMFYE